MEMNLSPEEVKLIQARRASESALQLFLARKLEVLRVAYEFEKWLQEHAAGATFSTFCDEFGYYGNKCDLPRTTVYSFANLLRDAANEVRA